MRISFMLQRFSEHEQTALAVFKYGDVLTINGDTLDLSAIQEGDLIPGTAVAHRFVAPEMITRSGGEVHVTLYTPYRGGDAQNPPPLISPPDGMLVIPDLMTEQDNG